MFESKSVKCINLACNLFTELYWFVTVIYPDTFLGACNLFTELYWFVTMIYPDTFLEYHFQQVLWRLKL